VEVTDGDDLATVVARVRWMLDLEADPPAVDAQLGGDPVLAALVAARPGLRSPAAGDGFEISDGRPEWAPWRSYATHHL